MRVVERIVRLRSPPSLDCCDGDEDDGRITETDDSVCISSQNRLFDDGVVNKLQNHVNTNHNNNRQRNSSSVRLQQVIEDDDEEDQEDEDDELSPVVLAAAAVVHLMNASSSASSTTAPRPPPKFRRCHSEIASSSTSSPSSAVGGEENKQQTSIDPTVTIVSPGGGGGGGQQQQQQPPPAAVQNALTAKDKIQVSPHLCLINYALIYSTLLLLLSRANFKLHKTPGGELLIDLNRSIDKRNIRNDSELMRHNRDVIPTAHHRLRRRNRCSNSSRQCPFRIAAA